MRLFLMLTCFAVLMAGCKKEVSVDVNPPVDFGKNYPVSLSGQILNKSGSPVYIVNSQGVYKICFSVTYQLKNIRTNYDNTTKGCYDVTSDSYGRYQITGAVNLTDVNGTGNALINHYHIKSVELYMRKQVAGDEYVHIDPQSVKNLAITDNGTQATSDFQVF